MPTRRTTVLVVALALAAAVLTACGGSEKPVASKAFCRAADRYDTEIERQAQRGRVDTERQIARVEDLAATAPAEIRDEAQTFLDALRDVGDDPSVKDDPDVRRAVDDVNRYANQACGVYDRDSGI